MSKHIFSGSVVINGNANVYSSGSNHQIVGSGKRVTKQVPVSPFNEICMKGPMSLKFFASSDSKMEITADDNIVDLISATFQGGVLVLAIQDNVSFSTRSPLEVSITYPTLKAIDLKGSGNIQVLNLNEDKFTASISGSGNMDLDGTVEHCVLSLRGSGNFDALPLKSNNLEVALSGSGNIFCTAINSAQVQLSGSGNVKVYGKPIHKSQNRTGSGNISFK